jgi:hypothetical protein
MANNTKKTSENQLGQYASLGGKPAALNTITPGNHLTGANQSLRPSAGAGQRTVRTEGRPTR